MIAIHEEHGVMELRVPLEDEERLEEEQSLSPLRIERGELMSQLASAKSRLGEAIKKVESRIAAIELKIDKGDNQPVKVRKSYDFEQNTLTIVRLDVTPAKLVDVRPLGPDEREEMLRVVEKLQQGQLFQQQAAQAQAQTKTPAAPPKEPTKPNKPTKAEAEKKDGKPGPKPPSGANGKLPESKLPTDTELRDQLFLAGYKVPIETIAGWSDEHAADAAAFAFDALKFIDSKDKHANAPMPPVFLVPFYKPRNKSDEPAKAVATRAESTFVVVAIDLETGKSHTVQEVGPDGKLRDVIRRSAVEASEFAEAKNREFGKTSRFSVKEISPSERANWVVVTRESGERLIHSLWKTEAEAAQRRGWLLAAGATPELVTVEREDVFANANANGEGKSDEAPEKGPFVVRKRDLGDRDVGLCLMPNKSLRTFETLAGAKAWAKQEEDKDDAHCFYAEPAPEDLPEPIGVLKAEQRSIPSGGPEAKKLAKTHGAKGRKGGSRLANTRAKKAGKKTAAEERAGV